ncbi:MAG TPA: TIGR02466 family protein [Rhizomicrobium sp.]|nr:TIGR02466 family protein [Rhizomicrobium sp.]
MINIMPIFINFLAVESLRLDNDRIEKFCLERKRASSGRVISNSGGWQSDNLDLATPELAELFAEVRKSLDEVHRAFEFSPSLRQTITEAWININQKWHFNYSHDHPGSLFSAVYYVKGGADKGELELKTPIVPHTYTISHEMIGNFNAFTGHAMVSPPVTGDLLIFPSWLLHRVNRSQSEEERISIAFNARAAKFA